MTEGAKHNKYDWQREYSHQVRFQKDGVYWPGFVVMPSQRESMKVGPIMWP